MTTAAVRLRVLLNRPGILLMPGCHDAISGRLVEEAGFELGFMSGFAVSAARLGMPDTGLISYAELVDQVAPKRCGHTEGKAVVSRDEALMRIRAAVDARAAGTDILIMARTDAR